jgi:hypothetical protein
MRLTLTTAKCWMSPEDAIAEIMHVHGLTLEEACEWLGTLHCPQPTACSHARRDYALILIDMWHI